jgi:hypothetical protein
MNGKMGRMGENMVLFNPFYPVNGIVVDFHSNGQKGKSI